MGHANTDGNMAGRLDLMNSVEFVNCLVHMQQRSWCRDTSRNTKTPSLSCPKIHAAIRDRGPFTWPSDLRYAGKPGN